MNDLPLLPHQKLDAYRLSRELAVRVRAAKIAHSELRDQAERASVSVFLAINEGLPHSSPRMRRTYYERARASLCETVGACDLAHGFGALDDAQARELHLLAKRVGAIIVGLLRHAR